ncbi:glycine--tRNA ligase subunit beta [Hydrococcus rivularis NIES-593]|uniref:Glycine--tRNA ligase beta subunit n=1 Tax=Hydrococcus rivularis NIES-593 TaxID=1921803 RepID=A0A1U7HEP7_9CYAN|nr:glycine--tRNA ligase subunit beta [Hydrococcus rivularis]OKH22053.1 glycine--tRNA ligase subunit beta [Hydrococcus rivularis NIES-593]
MPDFLLEVGVEELPADFVDTAIEQWQERIPKTLEEQFLNSEEIALYGTPRRLAILVKGLPAKQGDREEEIKGPPATAAFKDGKPTKAAEGFANKQGVDVKDLFVKPTDKGDFVFVQKKIPGRATAEILQELAPQWITGLEGRRFMRWGDGDLRFPRPIRWLVALLDKEILPIELTNGSTVIKSDRVSQGHRILHPEPVTIPQASDYPECLRCAYVEVDPAVRRSKIQQQVETAAQQIGGKAYIPSDLLNEVTNLVEYPTAVVGKFDAEFLNLPAEVISTVMVSHQRYFPVASNNPNNSLLPNFITISNGDPAKSEIIAAGNERVIRARLADAKFFYQADCDEPLESYLPELANVTFQDELGTMRDKVDRIIEIAQQIAEQLDLTPQQRSEIESTATLCKADLVTQMVYEFPELQGIMGQKYALASGESENVAQGIFEHYLPRTAEDRMPESLTGQVVGIADRLDTLVSIFGLGMLPTGSSDPFALRRAANAVINITWHAQLPIDLAQLLEQGAADFVTAHPDKESPLPSLQAFFIQRIHTLLEDDLKIDYDLVNAVLGEDDREYAERALRDLLDVRDRAQFLQSIRQNGLLDTIYETVNRSARLAVKGDLDKQQLDPAAVVRPELFEKPSEQAFYDALVQLVPQTQAAQADRNYQLLVDALAKIAPTVSNFFDGPESVLVMDENPEIRQNRLNLLGLLRNHARVLADFGAIVKS